MLHFDFRRIKMKKTIAAVSLVIGVTLLLILTGCTKKAKYDVTGKWAATIKYSSGKNFSPEWEFKQDGNFYEFGGEAWGTYSVKGDKIKITGKDEKEYYSGTLNSKTHMSGNFYYVGFEDKETITWEAVKVDE
jgi:hypothetical protein